MKLLIFTMIFLLTVSCGGDTPEVDQVQESSAEAIQEVSSSEVALHEVASAQEMETIMEGSSDHLVVLNFYADWCGPCQQLAPEYEALAQEDTTGTQFYRINIDDHGSLAQAYGVRGIPFTVFVYENDVVHTLPGLNPRRDYEEVVNRYAPEKKCYKWHRA
ncbi:thioredoxin family protein [Chitinivibrio alkaliphilus]|uniref:Thioredoxin n=1 Tax=Chitinivibrio alkaliphilus ACht1 TaxID=1313304 RepID=U7D9F2_9BACT|nr:thioredoxin domain-containing protein [Chitinivibrio alkaliphilus]ERP39019.1 Thioredoxin [Chitinivibrio alkaliphilus ACht1]